MTECFGHCVNPPAQTTKSNPARPAIGGGGGKWEGGFVREQFHQGHKIRAMSDSEMLRANSSIIGQTVVALTCTQHLSSPLPWKPLDKNIEVYN